MDGDISSVDWSQLPWPSFCSADLYVFGDHVSLGQLLCCAFPWLVFFLFPARVTVTLGFWKFRPPCTSLSPFLLSLCALPALASDLAHGAPWLMLSERTVWTEVWILPLGLPFYILQNPSLESSKKSVGLFSPSFSLACQWTFFRVETQVQACEDNALYFRVLCGSPSPSTHKSCCGEPHCPPLPQGELPRQLLSMLPSSRAAPAVVWGAVLHLAN